MENFPVAFILASCDEVYKNNNVLYRLVKPAKDACSIESTDRLVNVVPYRRKYQFKAKTDIEEFVHEILRRPLVLQPVLNFGRGIGTCGACYTEESWVVMINQTHPKILSRLQMGLDAARAAFERGHSAELRFKFGRAIQRLYLDDLKRREMEEAKGSKWRTFLRHCRFSEWEHADLIVRFHGFSDKTTQKPSENVDMELSFEDIVSEEVVWSQVGNQIFPRPHLASVSEDEIRQVLPSWTINGVSPLQYVGEEIPQQNYSYKKAGTLYESFRKKKKQRGKPPDYCEYTGQRPEEYPPEEELGAVGGRDDFDAIEHDFSHGDDNETQQMSRSNSRRNYMSRENLYSNTGHPDNEYNQAGPSNGTYENYPHNDYDRSHPPNDAYEHSQRSDPVNSHSAGMYENRHVRSEQHVDSHRPLRQLEVNGHIDADVRIVTPHSAIQHKSNKALFLPYENSLRLKKQDSDRSTGSTNADSGYSEAGQRSWGDSYDCNDNIGSTKFKYGRYMDEKLYNSEVESVIGRGVDNPAFSQQDEVDDALARHKRIVAEAMERPNPKSLAPNISQQGRVNSSEQVAESFI